MKKNNFLKSSGFYVLIFLAIIAVVSMITGGMETETSQEISSSEFMDALNSEEVDNFTIQPGAGVYEISGEYRSEQELEVADSSSDLLLFDEYNNKEFYNQSFTE